MTPPKKFPYWRMFVLSHTEAWRFVAQNPSAVLTMLIAAFGLTYFYEGFQGQMSPAMDLALKATVRGVWVLVAMSIGLGAFAFWVAGDKLPIIPFINLFNKRGALWAWRLMPYMLLSLILVSVPMVAGVFGGFFIAMGVLGADVATNQILVLNDYGVYGPDFVDLTEASELISILAISAFVLVLPGVIITFRLAPLMVAAMTKTPLSIRQAWQLSKGATFKICWAIFFALLPTLPWAWVFDVVRDANDGYMQDILTFAVIMAYLVNGVINTAITVLVWRHLRGEEIESVHVYQDKKLADSF